MLTFNHPENEDITEKGENAGKQYLLVFPQCFLPYQRNITSFDLVGWLDWGLTLLFLFQR